MINSNSEINMIQLSFIEKLCFYIKKIYIDIEIIDGNKLKTSKIVIISFLFDDKKGKSQFFENTFLLANISIDVVFGIFFFTLSNVKINFNNQEFR